MMDQQGSSMIYDITKTFETNVESGPFFDQTVFKRIIPPKELWHSFLGYKIMSPIGIPACAIMTGKGIALMSKLGFDVLTYKTARSHKSDAHPLPNICYVETAEQISRETVGTIVVGCQQPTSNAVTCANSFGNNCLDWNWLQKDIAFARASLSEGQVLIVSVYGTPQKDCTEAQDFARAAVLAQEAGAQVIELNLSCPNVKGVLVYKDQDAVYEICKTVLAVVSIPVIIKVGVFESYEQTKKILTTAARASARGVCGINTVPMQVVDKNGEPVFGDKRKIAGVSGDSIRMLGQQFAHDVSTIIQKEKLDLTLLATGGVLAPIHIDQYLKLGADVVMSAVGAMWNPSFVNEWHEKNSNYLCAEHIIKKEL